MKGGLTMILAIDMGNTQTEIGLIEGTELLLTDRIATDTSRTEIEYAALFHTIMDLHGVDTSKVTGAIISSVVPPLIGIIREAVFRVFHLNPLVVGPGVKNGLKIRIDDPRTLGADLVVDSVGALSLAKPPLIVIDMGTATTIAYIDEDSTYRGGVIVPGARIAINALTEKTSMLPRISLEAPQMVIGTNTIDAMKSGAVFGQASMIDGMIDRIIDETGSSPHIIATGGISGSIVPYCRHSITISKELMIIGLYEIYKRNRPDEA